MHTEPTIDASNQAEAWRSQSFRAQRPLRDELLDLAKLEFRVVRSGAAAKRLKINSHRCTLGSGEGCTVRLNDSSLRAMHAVILRDASRVLLRAYTVPIEVNGSLVNEKFLLLGDTFRLGAYLFELVDGPQSVDHEFQSSYTSEAPATPELTTEWDELATREFPLRSRPTPISIDETDRLRTAPSKSTTLTRPRLSFAGGTAMSFDDESNSSPNQSSSNSQTQVTQRAAQRQESDGLRREIDAWRRREAQWQEDQIEIRAELASAISRFNESQSQAQQATDAVSQMRVKLNEITHEFQTLSRQYEISLTENAQQQASMRSSIAKLERDREQVEDARKRTEDKLRQELVARQQLEESHRETQQALEEVESARAQALFEKDRAIADVMRMTTERDAAKKESTTLHESVAQSSRRIDALVKELENTSHRLADARREVTEAYEKVASLTAQVKKLEQQARASEQVESSQSHALSDAQRKNSQLVDQLAELTASRKQERSSWEQEARQLQQTVEQLSLELAATTGQLATTSDEHEATRAELNAAYERLTATRRELADAKNQPAVDESILEPLRAQLDEALQRPTTEQWQEVQQRLDKSEQQLAEARIVVNELQQQVEQQRLQFHRKEPNAGAAQPWSSDSSITSQTASSPTSSWAVPIKSAADGTAFLHSHSTTSAFLPSQTNDHRSPATSPAEPTSSANEPIASAAPPASPLWSKHDPGTADLATSSVDMNAYDWPTYQLDKDSDNPAESPLVTPAESPLVTPAAKSDSQWASPNPSSIDWAGRLAMLRREVLETPANEESTDSEPAYSASAWGWNPISNSAELPNDESQLEDGEAGLRLGEDDSVAERLQNFTSRDQRSHQQFATEAWHRSPGLDTPSEAPSDAPETTKASASEWWNSATDESATGSTHSGWRPLSEPQQAEDNQIAEDSEPADGIIGYAEQLSEPQGEAVRSPAAAVESEGESLGALAKQLIAQLNQQDESESGISSQDPSMADEIDSSRSIGSWMAQSPLWGQVEEQGRSHAEEPSEGSWSALESLRQQATSPYAQADELEVNEQADNHHDGTMMMPDWPSESSLGKTDSLDRYRQSDSDDSAEEPNTVSARQFEFQAQRYAVEEAEPSESMREKPISTTRTPTRGNESNEEDSIEDYMNRLLQRVQGNTVTSAETSPASPVKTADQTSINRYSNYTSPGVRNTSSALSSLDVMDPNAPIIPRSQAPEDANNMAAMRELANATAKSAIGKSVRGQVTQLKSRAIMDLMQAGVVLVCGFAFYVAGMRLSHLRLVWFTAAALAVALSFFFVYEMFRKLAAARRTYDSASRGDHSEDAFFGKDISP